LFKSCRRNLSVRRFVAEFIRECLNRR